MVTAPSSFSARPAASFDRQIVQRRLGIGADVVDAAVLRGAVSRFRERRIVLPTFEELTSPELIPPHIVGALATIDPDAAHPSNLFRIHWFNGPDRALRVDVPGHVVLPRSLTGVEAPIIVVFGDRFPMISAHKVLAAYGCLAPRLVTGQFDPTHQKAIWPSTGNFCRGGVAVSRIMGCRGVAVLPENMSQERFEWLGRWVMDPADIVRTPGSESNVKEIYDACRVLECDAQNVVLNQFCEFGNHLAHYHVTGNALNRVIEHLRQTREIDSLHSFVAGTGSAGTLAAGSHLKEIYGARIVAVEPAECPTLMHNGFGEHNIQGIGDKHVPYIHNVFDTDDVVSVSDGATDSLLYLATDATGQRYLTDRRQVPVHVVSDLVHLGFSSWANIAAAIRIAHAYDLDGTTAVITIAVDGAPLYQSERAGILKHRFGGEFDMIAAAETYARFILGAKCHEHLELRCQDRERIFNLSYFTWVEQQGIPVRDFIERRRPQFWRDVHSLVATWDNQIREFNAQVAAAP